MRAKVRVTDVTEHGDTCGARRRLAKWVRVRERHAASAATGGRTLLPTAHFRLRARPPPRAVVAAAASDAAPPHTTDDAAPATSTTAVAADASASVQVNPRAPRQPNRLPSWAHSPYADPAPFAPSASPSQAPSASASVAPSVAPSAAPSDTLRYPQWPFEHDADTGAESFTVAE